MSRWLHHLYAWAMGYFWLDCKRCGKGFGGHQWKTAHCWDGRAACPNCVPFCESLPVEETLGDIAIGPTWREFILVRGIFANREFVLAGFVGVAIITAVVFWLMVILGM